MRPFGGLNSFYLSHIYMNTLTQFVINLNFAFLPFNCYFLFFMFYVILKQKHVTLLKDSKFAFPITNPLAFVYGVNNFIFKKLRIFLNFFHFGDYCSLKLWVWVWVWVYYSH